MAREAWDGKHLGAPGSRDPPSQTPPLAFPPDTVGLSTAGSVLMTSSMNFQLPSLIELILVRRDIYNEECWPLVEGDNEYQLWL